MADGLPHTLRRLHELPLWARGLGVAGLVLAAVGLQWLLLGLAPAEPFLVFTLAVVAAGLLFGRGAASWAAALGAAATLLLFVEPRGTLHVAVLLALMLLLAGVVEALCAAQAALAAAERRHRALTEAGAVIVWRADPSGAIVEGRSWEPLTGQPEAAMRGWGWLEAVDPEDRDAIIAAWTEARAARRPAQAEFRVRLRDGTWRWMRGRGAPVFAEGAGGGGEPVEWIGVLEDVDERHRAEERRDLLAREVDHRARNVLSVMQAVLRLTPKGDPRAYVDAVEGRIAALARAHALLARNRWEGADLCTLAQEEMAAYGGLGRRVALEGPRLALAPEAAQALSMALHELATNAAKYGALSAATGHVRFAWEADREAPGVLRLRWEETGGPPPRGLPARRGFGTRLVESIIRGQLGGRIERRWEPGGLVCEIEVPLARASAWHSPAAGP